MLNDIRHAIRTLRRSIGFTAVAILALALGIGANTAIFTVIDSVLLRPLPFQDPTQLYKIGTNERRLFSISDPGYLAIASQNRSFAGVAAYSGGLKNLIGAGEPVQLKAPEVTASLWRVLGVNAILGRTFAAGENQVVVLSEGLWRSRFHADPSILGKPITLDATSYTVLGVMPASFTFPQTHDLWLPAKLDAQNTHLEFRQMIGRLQAGVTLTQAQAELQAIAHRVQVANPLILRGSGLGMQPLQETIVGKVRPALRVLFGSVSFLLLIACVNVANLLLARASRRNQEMAVRCSLGATRMRLIRQMLTESAILSIGGGLLGILLASWGVSALLTLVPPGVLPRFEEVRMDGQVLAFTLILSIVSSVFFGAWPAIQASKSTLAESLKQGFGRVTAHSHRVRNGLVVSEIALSLVLLIGAGLMMKSFLKLRAVDPGFHSENLLTLQVNLSSTYRTAVQMKAFHERALERLEALPGVRSAAAVNWLPLGQALIMGDFHVQDRPDKAVNFNVNKPAVSPGYFSAMGIRLLKGRDFTPRDDAKAPGVMIVGSVTARRVWGREDPIGKRISFSDHPAPEDWYTVIGVVDDVKQENLKEDTPPAIYKPLAQVQVPFFLEHMSYVVRTTASLNVIEKLSRARLLEVDPNQPLFKVASMEELLTATTAEPRFYSRVLVTFSLIALLLATFGIYGVIAYTVAQRTREIGIRAALGARPVNILGNVIGHSSVLIACGVLLGIGGALAATRVLQGFLFEVTPTDAATFAGVSVLLAAVALAASYIPARRAMRIDPMVALRYE